MSDQHGWHPWAMRRTCPDCGAPTRLYVVHCWECAFPGRPRPRRADTAHLVQRRAINALRRRMGPSSTVEGALSWAASQPDRELLHIRNLGVVGLAYIRSIVPFEVDVPSSELQRLMDAGLQVVA